MAKLTSKCAVDSKATEVRFPPELEKKLNALSSQTGRPAGELLQDAMAGSFDELAETREMLDRRYDEIESGKVKLVPGDEVFARLRAKSEARGLQPQCRLVFFGILDEGVGTSDMTIEESADGGRCQEGAEDLARHARISMESAI